MKKLFRPLVLGGVLLLAAGLVPVMPATHARAATVTDANLKQMLEDLLREHPEIVLDVLRSHSEDVLDIAQAGANARRKAALEAQWHKEVKNTPQKQISLAGRPVKGNAAAPVRIVAFSDFTCHYCQQATRVLDEVMKKYGKNVSLVYKHMPLDEQGPGMLAARYFVAVAAQSESKAWKFYDAMYADRDRLLLEGQKFVDEVCDRLGLDKARLKKDAASDKTEDRRHALFPGQRPDGAGRPVRAFVRSGCGHRPGSGTLVLVARLYEDRLRDAPPPVFFYPWL
mgnify:CR=1 FL=1